MPELPGTNDVPSLRCEGSSKTVQHPLALDLCTRMEKLSLEASFSPEGESWMSTFDQTHLSRALGSPYCPNSMNQSNKGGVEDQKATQ